MTKQLHSRLTNEQVAAILSKYVRRELTTEQAMSMLELGRSQFFEWVKRFKSGLPSGFSAGYSRKTPNYSISSELEEYIIKELRIEKGLIDDPFMPVRFYNYSFIRDQIMKKYHMEVSVPTIIDRAKKRGSILRSLRGSITTGR